MVSLLLSNGAEPERRDRAMHDSALQWFDNRCRHTPDRIAAVDWHRQIRLTYRTLHRRAERLAAALQSSGIGLGDRVAVLLHNQTEMLEAVLGCGMIGAIAVPLNWRLSVAELHGMMLDCEPKLMMYDAVEPEMARLATGLATGLPRADSALLPVAALDSSAGCPAVRRHHPAHGDAWMMIYTGGTTGKPKGVVLTHGSVYWNAVNTVVSWQLTAGDVTPTVLPMFHTGGLNALTMPVLMAGGTVVLVRSFQCEEMVRLLNEERCTIALMVPTMYHMLVHSSAFAEAEFPTMRSFLSGGAPCPLSVYQAFQARGLPFKEGYGATESGPNNFVIDPALAAQKPGSVGLPMMFSEAKLIPLQGDAAQPEPDQLGELALRGGHLFSYYWNNAEATSAAWREGWYMTGDLASRDKDGYYYIVGRKKDMIITGGENVYPLEVEQTLESCPGVKEAAVVGLADEKWGEVVAAVVAVEEGAAVTEAGLAAFCSARIGKYKVPKRYLFVRELPTTAVGKLDKKRMREWFGG
ncbi:long-chain fatty acid--CoA ligase [Paenibacillus dendritiformis]|uniref:class I adenylate-forming enzyme family protein n=1 Tax=Paenibacillus dendritiformis TaxID=130049 RepID=UPI00143D32E8|nr:AMP-binding protein [Paenibacillus dendritiformis]NKI21666.1 long-chain fatty acid--CoA ligase [Paenibacillus dendritiformis]NRF97950.1 AMP-binding protein [Paenibacillus dendritiformis]